MKIVFVCTGNTCRSPMAQAILMKKIDDLHIYGVEVDSCGLAANEGDSVNEKTINYLESIGINNFKHSAQNITNDIVSSSEYIITMTKKYKVFLSQCIAKEKLYCMDDFTGDGDILDPYGCDQQVYNETGKQIEKAVDRIVKILFNKD